MGLFILHVSNQRKGRHREHFIKKWGNRQQMAEKTLSQDSEKRKKRKRSVHARGKPHISNVHRVVAIHRYSTAGSRQ